MNAPAIAQAATPADMYAFWRRWLAGERPDRHDGDPQPGFYRDRSKAVAYWFSEQTKTVRCKIDDAIVSENEGNERWLFVEAVSHEAYKARLSSGNWPTESEAVTRDIKNSTNAPDANSFEGLQDRIEDLRRDAEKLIKAGAATTQETADQAADVADRLQKLAKAADEQREVEKRPHWNAATAVDDKWRPLTTAALIYKTLKSVVGEPFLKAKKAEKEKAEQAAREAATQAAAKAAELARAAEAAKASPSTDLKQIAAAQASAEAATQEAAQAEARVAQVAATKVTAGTRGKAMHLAAKTVVTIADRAKVLAHFADRQEVTDLLQSLAEKSIKAGIAVPGASSSQDSSAR